MFLHPKRTAAFSPRSAEKLPLEQRPRYILRPLTYVARCDRLDLSRGADGVFKVGSYNLFTLRRGIKAVENVPPEVSAAFKIDEDTDLVALEFFDHVPQADLAEVVEAIDKMSTVSESAAKS